MLSTLDDERREVWTAVLDAARQPCRPDRGAACRYLLRHLLASGARGFGYDGLRPFPAAAPENLGGDLWQASLPPLPSAFRPSGRSA